MKLFRGNRARLTAAPPWSNAGARCAPAGVAGIQSTARWLSLLASAFFDSVIDGNNSRCGVGRHLSPSTSMTFVELPRRASRPLAVLCRYDPRSPPGPHHSQLMNDTDSCLFCRRGSRQWSMCGMSVARLHAQVHIPWSSMVSCENAQYHYCVIRGAFGRFAYAG